MTLSDYGLDADRQPEALTAHPLWRRAWLGLAAIGAAWSVWFARDIPVTAEGGAIERLSLVLLVLALLAWMAGWGRDGFARYAYTPLVILLLAERELDAGPAFMESDVLSVAFWSGPLGPVHLAAALLIAWLICALSMLPVSGPTTLWHAVRVRARWTILLGLGGAMAIVAQLAEGAHGGTILGLPSVALEEGLELGFACLLFLAVLSSVADKEDANARSDTDGSHCDDYMAGPRSRP